MSDTILKIRLLTALEYVIIEFLLAFWAVAMAVLSIFGEAERMWNDNIRDLTKNRHPDDEWMHRAGFEASRRWWRVTR